LTFDISGLKKDRILLRKENAASMSRNDISFRFRSFHKHCVKAVDTEQTRKIEVVCARVVPILFRS
jgi:hypothetical protein